MIELLGKLLLISGAIFVVIGAIGLLRFPDVYTRIHAASVVDTLGAGLVLIGLGLIAGVSLVTIKLILILALLLLTGPTATHALAKAAIHGRLPPHPGTQVAADNRK